MEKNPFNPITEPASYQWFNEKPKEEKSNTKPMWPNIELELDTKRNVLHTTTYVNHPSGNLQLVKHSRAFARYLSIQDFKIVSELMEYEVKRALGIIN